jgi:hypothetical protein
VHNSELLKNNNSMALRLVKELVRCKRTVGEGYRKEVSWMMKEVDR